MHLIEFFIHIYLMDTFIFTAEENIIHVNLTKNLLTEAHVTLENLYENKSGDYNSQLNLDIRGCMKTRYDVIYKITIL